MKKQIIQGGEPPERTLADLLESLHGRVAETLEERLMDGEATDSDIRATLALLKQNGIQVKVQPDLTDHTDELEVARRAAEDQKRPFPNIG